MVVPWRQASVRVWRLVVQVCTASCSKAPHPQPLTLRRTIALLSVSLPQVDGSSHVVHSEEEALGTRLTIDSRTCLLSNEHDPSKVGGRAEG